MISPFWIIENFERDNGFEKLVKAVKKQGYESFVMPYIPFEDNLLKDFPDESQCVLFQGSISFAKKIQLQRPDWVPGVWCSWQNYECLTYYAHWGQFLLNNDYIMLPVAEVERRKTQLMFCVEQSFFMRPSNGSKSFSGLVISRYPHKHERTWEEWKKIAELDEVDPTELVVVALPKIIDKEWRVICTKDGPITGSRYRTHGLTDYQCEFPEDVQKYAAMICNSGCWQPDPIFAMDICEDPSGELHLLEIGAVSVSGLYLCDLNKFVEVASKIAIKEFSERF